MKAKIEGSIKKAMGQVKHLLYVQCRSNVKENMTGDDLQEILTKDERLFKMAKKYGQCRIVENPKSNIFFEISLHKINPGILKREIKRHIKYCNEESIPYVFTVTGE